MFGHCGARLLVKSNELCTNRRVPTCSDNKECSILITFIHFRPKTSRFRSLLRAPMPRLLRFCGCCGCCMKSLCSMILGGDGTGTSTYFTFVFTWHQQPRKVPRLRAMGLATWNPPEPPPSLECAELEVAVSQQTSFDLEVSPTYSNQAVRITPRSCLKLSTLDMYQGWSLVQELWKWRTPNTSAPGWQD